MTSNSEQLEMFWRELGKMSFKQMQISATQTAMEIASEIGRDCATACADNAPNNWRERAYDAFLNVLPLLPPAFIAKDVRDALKGMIEEPHDRRAWGGIILQAKKDQLVVASGKHFPTHTHGTSVTVWQRVADVADRVRKLTAENKTKKGQSNE